MRNRRNLILSTVGIAALAVAVLAGLIVAPRLRGLCPHHRHPAVPQRQIDAGGKMAFDVASIHPGDPDKFIRANMGLGIEDTPVPPGGRFIADFPLLNFIAFAYKLTFTPEQREKILSRLPKWIGSQPFLIEAKATGNPTSKTKCAS